jgi:hypothetical protein
VPALVEQGADLAALVADHDERVVDDVAQHVVAGLRDLGLMGQIDPGAPEHVLALELEHLLLVEDGGRQLAAA